MKTKSPKVYTLAQIYKLLRKGRTTVYKYVEAGLITLSPDKVAVTPGTRPVFVVSEAEYERLKRDGVDPTGIKAKTAKRSTPGKAAKKPTKRSASAAPAPAKKKSAYARGVTKKQVKRNAEAATRTAAKKQAKRSTATRKTTGVRRKK
jgi:hypothetical protein